MRIAIAIAGAVTISVAAQPLDALLEGCNTLQDPARRLECLKEASRVGVAPSQQGHTRLQDTITAMHGALDSGVSYQQYQELVLGFSKELGLFKAKNPAPEVLVLLDEAHQAYRDAGEFWLASIRYAVRQRNPLISGYVIPEGDLMLSGLAHLPSKYSMPLTRADVFGLSYGISRSAGLSAIWSRAKESVTMAFAVLDGTASARQPAK